MGAGESNSTAALGKSTARRQSGELGRDSRCHRNGAHKSDPRARYRFSALAWAGTITADPQRTKATERLVEEWMKKDANAAQTWVTQSQLPDAVKARFLPKQ